MSSNFYESIPIFDEFAEAVRRENYCPLPDDWVVGFSDVVGSTQAVAQGRYKAVNVVGAVYDQNSFLFRSTQEVGSYLRLAGGPTKSADGK